MTFISPNQLPRAAHLALQTLHQAGYEAFVVGGWIRDHLLLRKTEDVDLATNASPETMLELFKDYKTSTIGQDHGTIGVFLDEQWIEITTYRSDAISYDSRHPTSVDFVNSLKEDIIRRDFTMNALVMDKDGRLLDWVSGLDDIAHRRIRCVGHAETRFSEDALRILRAIRFMCKLDFKLELETRQAMSSMKSLLHGLAKERVLAELIAIMEAPYTELAFTQSLDVMRLILPELSIDANFHALNALTSFEKGFVFLYASQSMDTIHERLAELKASNQTQRVVEQLHFLLHAPLNQDRELKRALGRLGSTRLQDAFELKDALQQVYDRKTLEAKMSAWLDQKVCLSLKDLAIKGQDVVALGHRGPAIQIALENALEAVLNETLPNTKEALIGYLKTQQLDS